jgi:hypothetical protein
MAIQHMIDLMLVACHGSTVLRLLTYRRGDSTHKPGIAFLAWVLLACCGGRALDVVINGSPVAFGEAGVAIVLSVLAHRSRGNVARILRMTP